MDRVFDHLRYVRCPTCSRVFCCTKHRVEHERRVHVAVPGGPVIRRRFRSSQVLPHSGKQQTVHTGGHSTNGRKRLHGVASTSTMAQSIGSGLRLMEQRHHRRVEELRRTEELRCTEELRRTEERRWTVEQRAAMIEMCARTILKARRSSLTTIRHLRPVAESSPAVPLPQPCTPHTTGTDAAESATTPVEWSVVVSSVGSPPSFYQTPMQTPTQMFQDTPSVQKLPDTQMQTLSDTPLQRLSNMPLQTLSDTPLQTLSDTPLQMLSDTPLQTLSDTPVNGKPRCNGESVKRVLSDDGPTQKGFFWSNMARRFRWALRSTKPKVRENGCCPSPSAVANLDYVMVNPYGNIKPRRPICNNDTLTTPVHARPSLEAIRKAHEEASKAFNKFMTD
ncbi:uncharacterized protein LOC100570163 [Acyrthosiphon pisum]|uniref:C2H2-type domain-containing protein n=1 Tax=Acyrthosiphon pisum TaxID=7029 RepID=A0A8R1W728_ACYPI|nr:uncharacterized protein LOC100570163 [Acyrthosiphon pisum]|eukprot:XP_003247180.1 PREDICTED: uncharacterized protein LOC100570163 [Acyrthosiphon pisum]